MDSSLPLNLPELGILPSEAQEETQKEEKTVSCGLCLTHQKEILETQTTRDISLSSLGGFILLHGTPASVASLLGEFLGTLLGAQTLAPAPSRQLSDIKVSRRPSVSSSSEEPVASAAVSGILGILRRQPERCGSLFARGHARPVERLGDTEEPENVLSIAQQCGQPRG